MSIVKVASKKAKNGYTFKVYIQYKDHGILKSYSKSGFTSKKEAKIHEREIKEKIKNNEFNVLNNSKKTLKQVYEEFLEIGAVKYQANTIRNTVCAINLVDKDILNTYIIELNYKALQKFFNSRSNKGIESNKNIKKALNRVFQYAMKAEYITHNPIALIDITGIERHRDNSEPVLSYQDFLTLVDLLYAVNKFKYTAYAIAIQIGYYTGGRVSEVLALNKDDIDFEANVIDYNKKLVYRGLKKKDFYVTHDMKSRASHDKEPIAQPLKDSLQRWFEENPYDKLICDEKGNYIDPDVLSANVKRTAKANGIEFKFNFHKLRHSYVTELVNNGVDPKTVQKLARHSNFNTTMSYYAHINEAKKRQAIKDVFDTKYSKNIPKTPIN